MADSRKLITSLFVFVLIVCQSGVCMAAVSHAAADVPSANTGDSTHGCHDLTNIAERQDNGKTGFSLEVTGITSSDCCFTGTINTRDIVPDIVQFPVLVTPGDHEPDTYNSYHANGQYNNRGHPPEVPVFIRNTVLII